MKRFLALGLTLVLFLTAVAACFWTVGCQDAAGTDDPTATPTDTPTPTEEARTLVDIVVNGTTEYRLVRPDEADSSDPVVKQTVRLNKALKAATGCTMTIVTDWDDKDTDAAGIKEIVIGNTTRSISRTAGEGMQENQYKILFDGEKLCIIGGSDYALEMAVGAFLEEYLGYNSADDTYSQTALQIPEQLSTDTKFALPPVVYVIEDIQNVGKGGNNEDYNDVVRLYTCLQGCLNRTAKENSFWIYQNFDSTDTFWLEYIMGDGKLLDGCMIRSLKTWDELWEKLGTYVQAAGMVIWDPDVPSTANVASTICSADGYLPVRYDTDENSLYTFLKAHDVPEKQSLVGMFDGKLGTKIADTDIDSTGSVKCDPYLWALEKYMDRCNSSMIAYTLDGASAVATNAMYKKSKVGTTPDCNQIYSHDYYIYNRCFFIDLTCVADEKPCDDPDQPMGTDERTLATILSTMQERNNGNMTKLMGFPPWYMKYTVYNNNGKTPEVGLEWAFVDYISRYNIVKEADAWNPSWMTNASVYCQYEGRETYENTESPLEETFDEKTRYFTIYIGDYDSSAWLKLMVPGCFTDRSRGEYGLMWAFNPNLADRVPMIFDYVYENATANDYFVTGDSGAGYVFPSAVADLDTWVEYNLPYMERFDMDIVGFIINGSHKLTDEIMFQYAKIAPVGSFHNDGSNYLTIVDDETVFMHLYNDMEPRDNDSCMKLMYNHAYGMGGKGFNFTAFRTIRQNTNTIVNCIRNFEKYGNEKNDGYTYQYVDPYTMMDLILQSGQGRHIYAE